MQDTGAVYGAERATLDLARGLSEAGFVPCFLLIHEVRLGGEKSEFREAIISAGFSCQELSVAHPFSLKLVRDIRKYASAFRDVVVHAVGYKADIHAGLASKWGRLFPVVSTVHGWLYRPDLKEQFYKVVDLYALKRLSHVIVLSSYYEQLLLTHGIDGSRLSRIPSGMRVALPDEADNREEADDQIIRIGMLGRLSWEKNHEMLLRAVQLLREKSEVNFGVEMAGTGLLKVALEKRITDLDLSGCCRLAGYVNSDDFFERMDILVHCSRVENLPYSIMEAMARKIPVVGTSVGGIPDLISDRETGFLVDDDAYESLASVLEELIWDVSLRKQVGDAGYEKIKNKFSFEQFIQHHVGLYERVAGKKK